MDMRQILKAIGFLSVEAIGIPGNVIILSCFAHFRFCNGKIMHIDFLLSILTFINLVIVLIRGIPQCLHSLGVQRLFDQEGCNFVMLTYRVCRALSLCVTALLSCYQCVLLIPSSIFWAIIKRTLVNKLLAIIISLWCLNFLGDIFVIYSFSWGFFPNSTAHLLNLQFCLVLFPSASAFVVSGIVYFVRDLICIGLMSFASLYIVILLYRHKQQVKSIRSAGRENKNSAETRATNAVLMLASTYVFFFGLDNGIWLYTISSSTSVSPEFSDVRVFFASCYSALSPIVIIATNKKVQLKLRSMTRKKYMLSPETTITHISK